MVVWADVKTFAEDYSSENAVDGIMCAMTRFPCNSSSFVRFLWYLVHVSMVFDEELGVFGGQVNMDALAKNYSEALANTAVRTDQLRSINCNLTCVGNVRHSCSPMYPFNLLRLDLYLNESQIFLLIILAVPVLYYLYLAPSRSPKTTTASNEKKNGDDQPQTVMQPENPELAPPLDDPFTVEQLKEFDGSHESKPIYVAIKRMCYVVFVRLDR